METASSSSSSDDLTRILEAFEQSPVTAGRSTLRDLQTARELLARYSAEQIVCGILLGSARRASSAVDRPELRAKVNSLAYFESPIAEAAADKNFTPSYARMLRHCLGRFLKEKATENPQRENQK